MIDHKHGLLVDRIAQALQSHVSRMMEAGETTLPKERELAEEYGISVRTVRKALKGLKDKRVLRSIPGKGTFIVPKSKRQHLTLVLTSKITHPFTAMATEIILDVLREKGIPAVVSVIENGKTNWKILGLSPQDVGGILVLAPSINKDVLKSLQRDRVPIVVMGDFNEAFRQPQICHQVRPDTHASCYLATRHLLQEGHRNILTVCWGGEMSWGKYLIAGYKNAIEEAGLPFNADNIIIPSKVHFDTENKHYVNPLGNAQKLLDKRLNAPDAPTAIIHNSAIQLQANEMMHTYFHDRFNLDSIISLNHVELLERGYLNGEQAWAVAMPYRDLVIVALYMLENKHTAPLALTINGYQMWQRNKGKWHTA